MLPALCGTRGSLGPLGGCLSALGRLYASAAAPAAHVHHDHSHGHGHGHGSGPQQTEAIPLQGPQGSSVLVALRERAFAPPVELTPDMVAASADTLQGERLAVVREAFSPYDAPPRTLAQVVRSLGGSSLALHPATQDPAGRVLVDTYTRTPSSSSSSSWRLEAAGADLSTWLARQGASLALTPDLARAAEAAADGGCCVPMPNSVKAVSSGYSAQCTNTVLMVAPTAFGFNEQAAQDNSFMHSSEAAHADSALTRTVLQEYAGLYRALTEGAGVQVSLFQHHLRHGTPDAVFPNNWFSTHAPFEGQRVKPGSSSEAGQPTLVLYPMKCPNRAAERRPDILGALQGATGGRYTRLVDLSPHEQDTPSGHYFEGTGVLVLDRINGVAYVSLSERADKGLAEAWVKALGYKELVAFHSVDQRGKAVYHTNVMMAVGTDVAVVCAEAVPDFKERKHLLSRLSRTHTVVPISSAQMDALCGNVLEVQNGAGLPVLAMSSQAYHAFTPEQRSVMRRHVADLVHAPIDTLERVGGGGVRCAIAELF